MEISCQFDAKRGGQFERNIQFIPESHIPEFKSNASLDNLSKYELKPEVSLDNTVDYLNFENETESIYQKVSNLNIIQEPVYEISLISASGKIGDEFVDITNSINIYLIKNKGNSADFNIIKDIVTRNTDSVDEGINLMISIPLYLGLVGTMFGVIIGLWGMSDLSNALEPGSADTLLGNNITILLNGVKIAMMASLIGLLLTIVNSALIYKFAKQHIEKNKNKFFNFIQTELLPDINRDLAGTFSSLQAGMAKFNNDFSNSINALATLVKTNHDTLQYQSQVITDINKIDILKLAKYNVKVFERLDQSLEGFDKFNVQFENINSVVKSSSLLSDKLTEILDRTSDFEDIAIAIKAKVEETTRFMEFIQGHLSALDEIKRQNISTVVDYGDAVTNAVGELKEHIYAKIQSIKDITIKEEDLLIKALSENRNNLGKLSYLENLNTQLNSMSVNSNTQGKRLESEIHQLNLKLENSISVLQEINKVNAESSIMFQIKRIWIKVFGKK